MKVALGGEENKTVLNWNFLPNFLKLTKLFAVIDQNKEELNKMFDYFYDR